MYPRRTPEILRLQKPQDQHRGRNRLSHPSGSNDLFCRHREARQPFENDRYGRNRFARLPPGSPFNLAG